jgi:hypothetical protein
METHQYLIELLDELEAVEPKSDEHKKLNVRINQYFMQASMFAAEPIPNKLLFRTTVLGFRKDGVLTSLWAMRKVPKMVIQEIKTW